MSTLPRLNRYGALFALSLLAALGLAIIDGFGTSAAAVAVFAVFVLFVAMYRNDDDSEPNTSERDDGTSDRDKEAMVGPAEGDL